MTTVQTMNEKSIEYWQKREKKWQEECQKEDQQWQKDLMKVYEELGAEIQEEIERFLLRYASAEGVDMRTAQQMLDSTDMKKYAALAKKYCTQAAKDMENGTYAQDDSKEYFTEQANAEMRRYNARMKISRLWMLESQLSLKILAAQSKTNAIVETATQKRAMEEFTRQAGILGNTVLDNMDDVDTLIHASFHGATFSDRIWGPHQEQLQKKLQKALRNSLILGQGLQPFVRELHKELGVTKRQAARLLGTELARVQVQANLLSIKESGFEEFTFIAAAGCCKDCQEANGEHYKVDDAKDGLNLPPVHPNCRCTIAPYMGRDDDDGFDEEVFDEWSESYEEHGLSWEEWKERRGTLNQRTPRKKIAITSQALDKVKRIDLDGFTEDEALYTQDIRKRMLKFARDENNSNEVACLIDSKNRETTPFVKGSRDETNILSDPDCYHWLRTRPEKSIELSHNHPSGAYFSLNDLNVFMLYPAIRTMTAITNQGKTWYISKSSTFDIDAARDVMTDLMDKGFEGDELVERFLKKGYKFGVERN